MTAASGGSTLARLSAAATAAIGGGDWPKAEAVLRRLVNLRGAPAEAHYNLAQVLSRSGKPEQAGHWLRSAVAIRPNYASAWFELGRWLIDRRDFGDALDAFAHATHLTPNDADGWRNLARVAHRTGDYARARDAWRAFLRLSPDTEGQVGLMQVLLELRDPAGEDLRAALWAQPEIRPLVVRAVTRASAGRLPISSRASG